jgi:GNAT superfamily N-acetyltransferase
MTPERSAADHRIRAGVRRLGDADAGELLTLQLAAWVREARANATLDIPPLREGLADVRAQLADPAVTVWGLREDGRLLATVRTSLTAPTTAYLGRLGVVPDLVGHGLGGAMLRLAEARLPPTVQRVDLVTGLRSYDNHAFYARHGYAIVGRDEDGGIVHMSRPVAYP